MNPHERFCHNPACWAYGRQGEGHVVIHGRRERRYQCKRCAKTFSATTGTALYRAHKPHEQVVQVVTRHRQGIEGHIVVASVADRQALRTPKGAPMLTICRPSV